MKGLTKILIALSSLVWLASCQDTDSQSQKSSNSKEVSDSLFESNQKSLSLLYQKLIQEDEGHFRGITLGCAMWEVEKLESAEQVERSEDYLRYGIEAGIESNADVEYFFDSDILSGIVVSTYQVDQEATDELYSEISLYLKRRLGAYELDGDTVFWNLEGDSRYQMVKIGQTKAPGLELRIFSL